MLGIVKKNGIMVVDFALQRIDEGWDLRSAIHEASVERFRPIMMTTLAALMGAIPLALGFGQDASSRRPLGLVIVGGLIFSQMITLFVTPVIYLWLEWFQEHVLDECRSCAARTLITSHGSRSAAKSVMICEKIKPPTNKLTTRCSVLNRDRERESMHPIKAEGRSSS